MSVTGENNYIFVNKKGEVFPRTSSSWSFILSNYADTHIGFESTNFKLDKETWKMLVDVRNTHITNATELDMFNALCLRSKFRVSAVFYGFKLLYTNRPILYISSGDMNGTSGNATVPVKKTPTKITSFAFITEAGRWYIYKKPDKSAISLLEALKMYVNEHLYFSKGFTVAEETWDTVTIGKDINNDGIPDPKLPSNTDEGAAAVIRTFNALCRRSKDRLAAVCAFGKMSNKAGNGAIYIEDE